MALCPMLPLLPYFVVANRKALVRLQGYSFATVHFFVVSEPILKLNWNNIVMSVLNPTSDV